MKKGQDNHQDIYNNSNQLDNHSSITSQQVVQPAYDEDIDHKQIYTLDQIRDFTNDWLDYPKKVVQEFINKYGLPQEATNQRLIWHNNGVWKYSEIENAQIPHNFPYPHLECLTQVINFRITPNSCSTADFAVHQENNQENAVEYVRTRGELSPEQIIPDFCRDIAWFNGSISMDRTKGELASRSADESLNYLSINLAKDIICGKRTVEQARSFFAENFEELQNGQTTNYTQGLLFIPENDYVGDTGMGVSRKYE